MTKLALALAFVLGAACSSTTINNGSADSGATCGPPSTGDGTAACGPKVCPASTYCSDNVSGTCPNGCTASSNCASGLSCDLSNPTHDPFTNGPVGTCRAASGCSSDAGVGTRDSAACIDAHGVYAVVLNTASSSAACSNVVSSATCSVTQAGCTVTWSCMPDLGFASTTIDSSGSAHFAVSGPGGAPGTCTAQFTGGSFSWDCQFTGTGGTADCKGSGTLQ